MNAPPAIAANPRRDVYIPTVQMLLPGCEGDELRYRCGILMMRDHATGRARWCTSEVGELLIHIQRLATQYAFTSMPLEELEELHHQLVRLSTCASDLARLFPPAAAEGVDARG